MVVRALSSLFTHLTFAAEKNPPLLALSKLSMVKTKPELKVLSFHQIRLAIVIVIVKFC